MKPMKLFRVVCLVAVTALLAASGVFAQGTVITLLHVNDTHSHLDATGPKDAALNGTIGGMAKAATVIGTERAAAGQNVLLLHAGDVFHGDLFFNRYFGIPEFRMMQQLGFDAMAVGNHEFDLGPDTLAWSLATAFGAPPSPLPLLSANLAFPDNSLLRPWIDNSIIKNVGGVTVGIFGMTVPGVPTTNSGDVTILGADNAALLFGIAAQEMAALRGAGAKVVICLSHLGILYDRALAANVPGIDLIVGGHDHYAFEQPISVANPGGTQTLIVQAGDHYRDVGRLRFSVEGDAFRMIDYALLPVDAKVPAAPGLQAAVDELKAGIVAQYGDVYRTVLASAEKDLGTTTDPDRRKRDSAMGNLITDALRHRTRTDIAITANGLISEGITAGPIVGADIFRPVSYGYDPQTGLGLKLATFDIRGVELVKGLEIGLAYLGINEDFFLQVSGMRFRYDSTRPPGSRVLPDTIHIGGHRFSPTATYSVTVNEGLAFLLPRMGLQVTNLTALPDLEYIVLRDYVTRLGTLDTGSQGRIMDEGIDPGKQGKHEKHEKDH
ncbi:MAG TPA: bifunctional UDP-sugar hydrolase/5'-nucleotidase [Candidatus Deferrimicrobiaceae bacterium]|jgi:5'-nucleotidase